MHESKGSGPQQRTLLELSTAYQGVLAPPHSSITRGHVTYGHDLVAISMGPGGWVLKLSSKQMHKNSSMLEPKW